MTNSKSVDNYRFMTAEPLVMNNRTYCLIDGIQFVIYTIAPDLLPFSQTVVRDTSRPVSRRAGSSSPAGDRVPSVETTARCHDRPGTIFSDSSAELIFGLD